MRHIPARTPDPRPALIGRRSSLHLPISVAKHLLPAALFLALCTVAPALAAPPAPPTDGAALAPGERVLDVTLTPTSPTTAPPTAAPPAPHTAGSSSSTAATWPRAAARHPKTGSSTDAITTLVVALLAAALLALRFFRAWRRRSRRCPTCHTAMQCLNNEAAFAELDMAERTEHLVGDVLYTVWRCPTCAAIAKQGIPREVGGLAAGTLAAPVGSAAYRRRHNRASLSIWSAASTPTAAAPPSIDPANDSPPPGIPAVEETSHRSS